MGQGWEEGYAGSSPRGGFPALSGTRHTGVPASWQGTAVSCRGSVPNKATRIEGSAPFAPNRSRAQLLSF